MVDQFAEQLTTPNSNLRSLIQQNVVNKLDSLNGNNPPLPVGPVADGQKGQLADSIQRLIANQKPELVAAIRAGAQAKVNQLKAQLANQVANSLTSQLNRSFSFLR